jgi:amino acid transporter
MSLLLTNSRLPYVLARDGRLPVAFAAVHPQWGTPWLAVVLSGALYAIFAVFSFRDLVVLNVWLYSLSLVVELAAFMHLRRAEPGLPRPWRVPGGRAGAVTVTVIPSLLAGLAMATAGWLNTAVGVLAALTGPLAWGLLAGVRRAARERA